MKSKNVSSGSIGSLIEIETVIEDPNVGYRITQTESNGYMKNAKNT